MIKITSNFDADSLEKEILKKAKEQIKQNFTKDINKIARPFGEKPKIEFVEKQKGFDVKVGNVSDELKAEIDKYIKKSSK